MAKFLALVLLFASAAANADTPGFTRDQAMRVLWHGPWPPARPLAPRAELKSFGERLFFDPALSGTGSVLCATCHIPYRAFQDGKPIAFGLEQATRNTPSVLNAGYFRRYGWDGGRASLAAQSVRPLLDPREMRSSAAHVAQVVRSRYGADYARAFGALQARSDEQILADVGTALAAFEQTLVTRRTPFDEFRDFLGGADNPAGGTYPPAAQRGLKRFVAECSTCHAGPLFSDGAIVRGIRVPTLRNVELTSPYMHDGSVASLADAARHNDPDLKEVDVEELVAFLKTLTETAPAK
jgi:cytochrome c peroxidase